MNVIPSIRGMLSSDRTIIFECRRCGTTLEAISEDCPYCEVDDIVRYEIS